MSERQPRTNWLSSILRTGRWYLLSSIATKVLALVTLTILTRHLSPEEFGALNTLIALTQALPILLSLYLDAALGRLYHDDHANEHQLAALFSTVFWFVLVSGGISVIVFTSLYSKLVTSIESVPLIYIWIAMIPILLLQLAQLGIMSLRQSLKAKTVTKIEGRGH